MYDPAQLAALEAVLRLGAFDGAAAELAITPSAVSQRIRALEDRVGAPLVLRQSPARATPTGARLCRHARELALLDAALAQDLGRVTEARVRIALNADSLDTWAIPALAETDFLFDIVIEDETAAHHILRDGEVCAAITTRAAPLQGCDVLPLGVTRYIATCAPGFAKRYFPDAVTAATLGKAPMLDFSGKDRLQRGWLADVFPDAPAPPVHILPSTHGFVTASVAGLGWGLNPLPLVEDHIANGTLIALSDSPRDVALYWQVSSHLGPALRPLTKALQRAARNALLPIPQ